MKGIQRGKLFELGELVITSGAARKLADDEVRGALGRHARGDWGDVCGDDRQANDDALKARERLLSVYRDRAGTKYYIITEWDRSLTTILLAEEY